jgi:transcriptional regulator with XRE-family HTH domain
VPKRSSAIDKLPTAAAVHLQQLGENLAIARKRRKEPIRIWAERIGVSAPTVARMERGDPSVAMGVYATALWLIGRDMQLPALAEPAADVGALEEAVRAAARRSVRKAHSVSATLRGENTSAPKPSAAAARGDA